ncbi:MAG TPA: hypothetical protein ENI82_06560 [Bacteroidetes bacterium]|nr:hypothetical protein [Bacteroidota bacterium]
MKFIQLLFLSSLFFINTSNLFAQEKPMNNAYMNEILKEVIDEVQGELGNWQFIHNNHLVLIITDEAHNRMRIFTPVIEEQKLEDGQLTKMLKANFHSALDAKYCLFNEFVITVFTHPLKELQKDQFIDAIKQVLTLADTFGTTYSSTELIFSPGIEESEKEKEADKKLNQKPKLKNG